MLQPKGTVLVVDDLDDGRFLLACLLSSSGYHVIEAATGTEACARIEDGPDVVVLDVKLPDIDGFQVCRRIKADPRTARTPIVMVSAVFSATEHRVRGLGDGADAYLPKPFDPELLVATIEALMRQRATERALAERNALLRLESELARLLVEPACVAGDPTALLHAVANALDAEMAEFWRIEVGDGVAARAGVWHETGIDDAAIDDASAGVGELFPELAPRRVAAVEALGLRSVSVIPVLTSAGVTGALLLFRRQARYHDHAHLEAEVRERLRLLLERPGAARALGLVKNDADAPSPFPTGVAHELGKLLMMIGARAEYLKDTLAIDPARRQELDTIIGATRRAANLVQRAPIGARQESE
jgi:CheY-like chemotaxis protein